MKKSRNLDEMEKNTNETKKNRNICWNEMHMRIRLQGALVPDFVFAPKTRNEWDKQLFYISIMKIPFFQTHPHSIQHTYSHNVPVIRVIVGWWWRFILLCASNNRLEYGNEEKRAHGTRRDDTDMRMLSSLDRAPVCASYILSFH